MTRSRKKILLIQSTTERMAYSKNTESGVRGFLAASTSVVFKHLFLLIATMSVLHYIPRKAKISTHESFYVALGVVGASYVLDTFVPSEHQVLQYLASVTGR